MQSSGWVWEHWQDVRFSFVFSRCGQALPFPISPFLLPFRVDRAEVQSSDNCMRSNGAAEVIACEMAWKWSVGPSPASW